MRKILAGVAAALTLGVAGGAGGYAAGSAPLDEYQASNQAWQKHSSELEEANKQLQSDLDSLQSGTDGAVQENLTLQATNKQLSSDLETTQAQLQADLQRIAELEQAIVAAGTTTQNPPKTPPPAEPETPPPAEEPPKTEPNPPAATHLSPFDRQFQSVLNRAQTHVAQFKKAHPNQKIAVGMDLDETMFDNTGGMRKSQKHYTWDQWKNRAKAPAFPASKALFEWFRANDVTVFFITARQEDSRAATVRNLNHIGIPPSHYGKLYMKPNARVETNKYKVSAQKNVESKGYAMAAMIGDKQTDVAHSVGKGFKVPHRP